MTQERRRKEEELDRRLKEREKKEKLTTKRMSARLGNQVRRPVFF